MAKFDTLEYNGIERTLAARGFSLDGTSGTFGNQRADTLHVTVPGGQIADPEIFPFEAVIIFRLQRDSDNGADGSFSGGAIEFTGKRVGEVVDLRPNYEGVKYEFQGPWYDLEHTTYQQPFGSWQSGALTFPYQSELLLFTELNTVTGVLSFITNGAQVRDILQFLLDQYAAQGMAAPYQIGTIDPALKLLPLPCRPMPCSDAILKCLELSSDCTVSFDYTVTPPRVNVKSVYALAPATLPIADGVSHKSLRIVPRPDLRPRGVVVVFKNTSVIDGVNFIGYLKQKYGPHGADNAADPDSGLRVIVDWLDVLGPVITTVNQSIEVAAVNANAAAQADRRAWWALHDKKFADLRLRLQNADTGAATTIPDATVTDADTGAAVSLADYPNELLDGTIAPWMGFNVKRVRISVPLTYAIYDKVGAAEEDDLTGTLVNRYTQKEHHIEITVTDGVTGTYSTTASETTGEVIPADLALNLWTALNRLQYEGDYVKVQAAINGGISMLNCLNLSNGRPEWATMNAQIQSITKDYGRGTTQVTIGPAKHLNADHLMSIFQAWRFRFITYNPAVRASGNPGTSSSGTEISKNAPKKNTMEGLENPSAQVLTFREADSPTGALKGQSFLDPKIISDILGAATPAPVPPFTDPDVKVMQPREVLFCDEAGAEVWAIAHLTGFYTK
jgi:hypothetical protein